VEAANNQANQRAGGKDGIATDNTDEHR
jgi:hypothetical protein